MKKKYNDIEIVCIILSIIFVILLLLMIRENYKESHKNHFTFDSTLVVRNVSSYSYLDTLTLVTLDKIFNYKNVTVTISNMPISLDTKDTDVSGFITKDPFKEHNYFLYVNTKRLGISKIGFISHELAHLRQMERGNLIPISSTESIYLGDTIFCKAISYKNRPYEIDAREDAEDIEYDLNKLIYKH